MFGVESEGCRFSSVGCEDGFSSFKFRIRVEFNAFTIQGLEVRIRVQVFEFRMFRMWVNGFDFDNSSTFCVDLTLIAPELLPHREALSDSLPREHTSVNTKTHQPTSTRQNKSVTSRTCGDTPILGR